MTERFEYGGLDVAAPIVDFVERAIESLPLSPAQFWDGLAKIVDEFTPRNEALLCVRDTLQAQIDAYYSERRAEGDPSGLRAFLNEIGYLRPAPAPFVITTSDVDPEIASQPGPQLVVPLMNARFAINAANARWGSLYDALYGTDAVAESGGRERGTAYNPLRGAEVIRLGRELLDATVPLESGSHADVEAYWVSDGILHARTRDRGHSTLGNPDAFVGFTGRPSALDSVLLLHHGLHIELVFDPEGTIGRDDLASVQDIVLESAITTIMDLEDSVAAVDAEDKALGYRNWRGLVDGTLVAEFTKNGRTFQRTLAPDRHWTTPGGGSLTLPGRSLLLVRNVSLLMRTDAVRDRRGANVFEGILDAVMTALGATPTLLASTGETRARSMYVVKPKLHGPDEVTFTMDLFARTEQLLGLPPRTLKVGVMDEERRTSLNLAACIAAAADRIVFINTGFLDRTGDEIHTSLYAGAMVPKAEMRAQPFMRAYEASNVEIGLRSGFYRRAQIGKGMWAMPDLMHDMVTQKIAHPESGATTAWVPSPTAATLHAQHYHQVDVLKRQTELAAGSTTVDRLDDLLRPPLLPRSLSSAERMDELDNNVQSILGYVVRWIDQGIGCSKVPDLNGVALMEDRATLRISSQILANWLVHGIISEAEVLDSLERMSRVVDAQNVDDPLYEPLSGTDGQGLASEAARRLILEGRLQPNGYTEPILHDLRRRKKSEQLAAAS